MKRDDSPTSKSAKVAAKLLWERKINQRCFDQLFVLQEWGLVYGALQSVAVIVIEMQ